MSSNIKWNWINLHFYVLSLTFCIFRKAVYLYFHLAVKYFLIASVKSCWKSMASFLDIRQTGVLLDTKWLLTDLLIYFFLSQPLMGVWQLRTPSMLGWLEMEELSKMRLFELQWWKVGQMAPRCVHSDCSRSDALSLWSIKLYPQDESQATEYHPLDRSREGCKIEMLTRQREWCPQGHCGSTDYICAQVTAGWSWRWGLPSYRGWRWFQKGQGHLVSGRHLGDFIIHKPSRAGMWAAWC